MEEQQLRNTEPRSVYYEPQCVYCVQHRQERSASLVGGSAQVVVISEEEGTVAGFCTHLPAVDKHSYLDKKKRPFQFPKV